MTPSSASEELALELLSASDQASLPESSSLLHCSLPNQCAWYWTSRTCVGCFRMGSVGTHVGLSVALDLRISRQGYNDIQKLHMGKAIQRRQTPLEKAMALALPSGAIFDQLRRHWKDAIWLRAATRR